MTSAIRYVLLIIAISVVSFSVWKFSRIHKSSVCELDELTKVLHKVSMKYALSKRDSAVYLSYRNDFVKRSKEFSLNNMPLDSTGLTPLDKLGEGTYQGFPGGLYPKGLNVPPVEHLQSGQILAAEVKPLNIYGLEDIDNGTIGFLCLGMSNTKAELEKLQVQLQDGIWINENVQLVNSAFGGQSIEFMSCSNAPTWERIEEEICQSGITSLQVQAIWLTCATRSPKLGFPDEAVKLKEHIKGVLQICHERFPNLKLCYLSGRSYGGYATNVLSPEPYAYETNFAVKWVIEDQINGDMALNYDAKKGEVKSPWISWGPYTWVNGMSANSNQVFFRPNDFMSDGIHPSVKGAKKIALMAQYYFMYEDPTARKWMLTDNGNYLVNNILEKNEKLRPQMFNLVLRD